jgi:Kef-type K+ transport system membrane component KefB
VGLIFAVIGKSLGIVSDEVFSVIVIMVILTTLLTPPILTFLLKRQPDRLAELTPAMPPGSSSSSHLSGLPTDK